MATIKGKTPVKKSAIKKAAAKPTDAQATDQAKTTRVQKGQVASADGIQRGSVPQEPVNKTAGAKVEQTQRADETPEAKRTPAEQKRAAEKLFANADDAALRGYPPEITREQHENIVRRAALGY